MLVFGHGYTAAEFSKHLLNDGWRVIGTTRQSDNLSAISANGVEARLWTGRDLTQDIAEATHILLCVAPGDSGDPVLATFGGAIAEAAGHLQWVGYLSTTAVYGDHDGGWVDEDTPPNPATKRGHWRVNAERSWQNLAEEYALPLHIFRLAGIYGPGRGPFAKVMGGTARRIIKKNQVFSRIHVEDIAQVLLASIKTPNPGAIYNLCDDEAAPPEDVIGMAADLLGLPQPEAIPFEEAEMTPMARSFYAESKRVRNHRIKTELGVTLRYPSYREGLTALFAEEISENPS